MLPTAAALYHMWEWCNRGEQQVFPQSVCLFWGVLEYVGTCRLGE